MPSSDTAGIVRDVLGYDPASYGLPIAEAMAADADRRGDDLEASIARAEAALEAVEHFLNNVPFKGRGHRNASEIRHELLRRFYANNMEVSDFTATLEETETLLTERRSQPKVIHSIVATVTELFEEARIQLDTDTIPVGAGPRARPRTIEETGRPRGVAPTIQIAAHPDEPGEQSGVPRHSLPPAIRKAAGPLAVVLAGAATSTLLPGLAYAMAPGHLGSSGLEIAGWLATLATAGAVGMVMKGRSPGDGSPGDRHRAPELPVVTPRSGQWVIRIGRETDSDYVVANTLASRRQCEIYLSSSGRWMLRDPGSTNGTFVKTGSGWERLPISTTDGLEGRPLVDGDQINVGGDIIEWRMPRDAAGMPQFTPAERAFFHQHRYYTIGRRDSGNDLRIDSRTVSNRHLSVRRVGIGQYEVMDLGSANGTWVWGRDPKTGKNTWMPLPAEASPRIFSVSPNEVLHIALGPIPSTHRDSLDPGPHVVELLLQPDGTVRIHDAEVTSTVMGAGGSTPPIPTPRRSPPWENSPIPEGQNPAEDAPTNPLTRIEEPGPSPIDRIVRGELNDLPRGTGPIPPGRYHHRAAAGIPLGRMAAAETVELWTSGYHRHQGAIPHSDGAQVILTPPPSSPSRRSTMLGVLIRGAEGLALFAQEAAEILRIEGDEMECITLRPGMRGAIREGDTLVLGGMQISVEDGRLSILGSAEPVELVEINMPEHRDQLAAHPGDSDPVGPVSVPPPPPVPIAPRDTVNAAEHMRREDPGAYQTLLIHRQHHIDGPLADGFELAGRGMVFLAGIGRVVESPNPSENREFITWDLRRDKTTREFLSAIESEVRRSLGVERLDPAHPNFEALLQQALQIYLRELRHRFRARTRIEDGPGGEHRYRYDSSKAANRRLDQFVDYLMTRPPDERHVLVGDFLSRGTPFCRHLAMVTQAFLTDMGLAGARLQRGWVPGSKSPGAHIWNELFIAGQRRIIEPTWAFYSDEEFPEVLLGTIAAAVYRPEERPGAVF